MSPMLDVSDDVRAEIGDAEANRLLAGDNAPGAYDCTSCRAPGDTAQVPTSTVLFMGDETAVLAFAHAGCVPSQVIRVSEEEVQGAVRTITADAAASARPAEAAEAPEAAAHGPVPGSGPAPAAPASAMDPAEDAAAYPPGPSAPAGPSTPAAASVPPASPAAGQPAAERAVLGVTCGQVLIGDTVHAAVVVEPTARIARPGPDVPAQAAAADRDPGRAAGPEQAAGPDHGRAPVPEQGAPGGVPRQGDDFLPLLREQGFHPVTGLADVPPSVPGWSVLVAMGRLHAILQPPSGAAVRQNIWWQAHQALPVTDGWRTAATQSNTVLVYAAPVGSIGQQPRENLLREALEQAASQGLLVGAAMPLAGA